MQDRESLLFENNERLHPIMILVIEDDNLLAKCIECTLRSRGFETVIAQGSVDGLHKIYQLYPDLVILEDRLSYVGELDICIHIHKSFNMNIILLSDTHDELTSVWGLERGADFCMSKPISSYELVARVIALLRRHQQTLNSAFSSMDKDAIDYQSSAAMPSNNDILSYCALHSDRPVLCHEILLQIWASKKIT